MVQRYKLKLGELSLAVISKMGKEIVSLGLVCGVNLIIQSYHLMKGNLFSIKNCVRTNQIVSFTTQKDKIKITGNKWQENLQEFVIMWIVEKVAQEQFAAFLIQPSIIVRFFTGVSQDNLRYQDRGKRSRIQYGYQWL